MSSVASRGTPGPWRARLDRVVQHRGRLWLCFFAYAVLVAGFVQLVALPYLFPDIHAGDGLLIEGDWLYHHQVAADLARRIGEEGWSVWQLRYGGEHVLWGVVSAVYALTVPEPWTLIPLHAALHATSTLVLVCILQLFVSSRRTAVAGALAFLLFPSSLITYAQISKDAYSICGGFMFVYGWLLLARWPAGSSWRQAIGIVALIVGGATLTWSTRPYLVEVMQGLSAGFAFLIVVRCVAGGVWRTVRPLQGALASAMAGLMVLLLLPFDSLGSDLYVVDSDTRTSAQAAQAVADEATRVTNGAAPTLDDIVRLANETERLTADIAPASAERDRLAADAARLAQEATRLRSEGEPGPADEARPAADESRSAADEALPAGEDARPASEAARLAAEVVRLTNEAARLSRESFRSDTSEGPAREVTVVLVPWTSSRWVPAVIDERMYSLAVLRSRWRSNEGRSTVDRDVMPASVGEVLAYLPRLAAVGFLAPFPAQWFEAGSFESTSLMRRAVGVEMVFVYLAWVGLALGVWRWWARLELWFVLAYGGITTLVLAFAIPNVGSLHRARYGFLMVLVALGIAGGLSFLSERVDRTAATPGH